MLSHNDSRYQQFQPPPPIRTATSGSQNSQSSGIASPDMLSPTSTSLRSPHSPTSPTDESFFGAITLRIRGRSHSRSRVTAASRKRSKSPLVMPPENFPPTSLNASPTSPTYAPLSLPQQSRHVSTPSQGSISSTSTKTPRPSLQGTSRRSTGSSDMWRGRHSNSWLFNDFSLTEQAKDLLHRRRK